MFCIADFGSWIQTMIFTLTKKTSQGMKDTHFLVKQWIVFSTKFQESLSQTNQEKCHMKILFGLCCVKRIKQQKDL